MPKSERGSERLGGPSANPAYGPERAGAHPLASEFGLSLSGFGFRTWSYPGSHEAPLKTHSLVLRCPVRLRNRGLARSEKSRRIPRTRIWPPAGPHERPHSAVRFHWAQHLAADSKHRRCAARRSALLEILASSKETQLPRGAAGGDVPARPGRRAAHLSHPPPGTAL